MGVGDAQTLDELNKGWGVAVQFLCACDIIGSDDGGKSPTLAEGLFRFLRQKRTYCALYVANVMGEDVLLR